ncbi:Thiamine pyrophosphate enzyme C-terminal TPP-binding [Penicillium expansum]|nr:Thiamine pyrophosphate enzyme C-terminal TPP-binding [Penicillium expansum]
MAGEVTLAEYLFLRLHQLGVRSVHGVPGDYNLVALDYVEPSGLHWVGNANELNAGYAADGYARIKGISALITAFGVGELSALNAIGGAYAEKAPVVHIVGVPSTASQDQHLCLHHSFGDGNFRLNAEIYAKFTCAQANLRDKEAAPALIDETLRQCLLQSRPVYIELPTDLVKARIPIAKLEKPIDLSVSPNDPVIENSAIEDILKRLYAAKQPFIIVDGFASRYGISSEADELVRVSGIPTSTTPFGKGIVNETYPNFHGIYAGAAGKDIYVPWVKSCDLVIRIAPLNADTNTYSFTTLTNRNVTIEVHQNGVEVCGAFYRDLDTKTLLRKLLDRLDTSRLPRLSPYPDLGNPKKELNELAQPARDAIIDQDTFWQRISNFFRPGDILMTETGTSSSGGRDFVLPPQTTRCVLAQREMISAKSRPNGRTILFEGDGSLQMSVQAIGDIIRNRLDITIFVINNNGYTIERYINGMHAGYNWVQPWRYLESARYFGAPENDPEYPVFNKRVENWGELMDVMQDKQLQAGKGFNMVEVIMKEEDAPVSLKNLVRMAAKRNEGGSEPAAPITSHKKRRISRL